jgi:hypothetical protein
LEHIMNESEGNVKAGGSRNTVEAEDDCALASAPASQTAMRAHSGGVAFHVHQAGRGRLGAPVPRQRPPLGSRVQPSHPIDCIAAGGGPGFAQFSFFDAATLRQHSDMLPSPRSFHAHTDHDVWTIFTPYSVE